MEGYIYFLFFPVASSILCTPTLTAAVVFSQQVEKLQGEREIAYLMTT